MFVGDGNIGDIEAADWRKILSIVDKSDVGYKLLPIKRYLNNQIESSKQYAESEKKSKFLGSWY